MEENEKQKLLDLQKRIEIAIARIDRDLKFSPECDDVIFLAGMRKAFRQVKDDLVQITKAVIL